MYDIHSHILSGIDDGAKSTDISISMARIACEKGVIGIIATPHYIQGEYDNCESIVVDEVEALNATLREHRIDITVYLGNEVFLTPDILTLYDQGKILTLNRSRYMLIELPMSSIPDYTEDVFFRLQLKGITPIIAHPERNHEIIRNPKKILEFIEKGAITQVNLGSITGVYGTEVRTCAEQLFNMSAVWTVASDSHSDKGRRMNIDGAYEKIMAKYGKNNADLLMKKNPQSIINDQDVLRIEIIKKVGIFDKIKHFFRTGKVINC